MTKPFALICIALIALSCSTQTETAEDALTAKLDSLLESHPAFSGVILVADHGQPLYHHAQGYSNYEKKRPLDTTAIFELASVSKQFTAMTIMMLQQEGKLSYDDPLEKYIPGLPYSGITIRNLLNHTSGLPDYQAVMDEHWDKTKVANNKDIIEYLIEYHPPKNFEPGEKYAYSNTGYVLLGSITEAVSGKDFVDFCRERIFNPLGMSDTDIRSNEEKKMLSRLALGHMYVKEKEKFIRADSFPSSNYTIWLGGRKGPGRVSSTASDLLKWDQALYSDQLVSQSTLEDAFTVTLLNDNSKSDYGFGWQIVPSSDAGRLVFHTGDNPGYRTIILRYLDLKKTIIILCNNDYEAINEVRYAVKKISLAKN